MRNFPRVLFVGRASVARRAVLEKSFSFRARRSRDRIAERAPRGGGLEICAWSSSLRQVPAHVLFVEQPSLIGKRIAVSRFGQKFSVRARGAPQAIFSRSRPKDRFIKARPNDSFITRACPFYQGRSSQMARHPDLSCALQTLHYPTQAVLSATGQGSP